MIHSLPEDAAYSIDTSSIVTAWARNYPLDMFSPLWGHVDDLIDSGIVVASAEVLTEIERQSDDLHDWCKERGAMFIDLIDPIQNSVTHLVNKYPKLVAAGRNHADPFVIGCAQLDSDRVAVVTEEQGGGPNRPKIPFICDKEGVRCIRFVDMLRETGWRMKR